MAKQWFNYVELSTGILAQIDPVAYVAVGAYPGFTFCALANRTCLIYTYTSSGSTFRPSPTHQGAPGISARLPILYCYVC